MRYSYYEERGTVEKRERERDDRSVYSDRSEKRARYESEGTMESSGGGGGGAAGAGVVAGSGGEVKKVPKREETPEEGEI